VEAVHLNPASAYREGTRRQLELAGLSASAVNNSFTVRDYNRYSGAYLSEADKNYLLDQVPESGLTSPPPRACGCTLVLGAPLVEGVAEGRSRTL
jgi:hypothetical protein